MIDEEAIPPPPSNDSSKSKQPEDNKDPETTERMIQQGVSYIHRIDFEI